MAPATPTPRMLRGDEADIYEKHHRHLMHVLRARVMTHDETVLEDASAHAWLQFLRYQPRRDTVFNWLCTVAIHEAWDLTKRRRGVVPMPDRLMPTERITPRSPSTPATPSPNSRLSRTARAATSRCSSPATATPTSPAPPTSPTPTSTSTSRAHAARSASAAAAPADRSRAHAARSASAAAAPADQPHQGSGTSTARTRTHFHPGGDLASRTTKQ
jgi:DNA-directed RNA polymerase specialized sigma24 family protein